MSICANICMPKIMHMLIKVCVHTYAIYKYTPIVEPWCSTKVIFLNGKLISCLLFSWSGGNNFDSYLAKNEQKTSKFLVF